MEVEEDLQKLQSMIWGPLVDEQIFNNWSAGFSFSESCHACLVQKAGGPCAILAPVQAFVIKHLLPYGNVHQAAGDRVEDAFVLALQEMLQLANGRNGDFTIVSFKHASSAPPGENLPSFTDQLELRIVKNSELLNHLKESAVLWQMEFGILCFLYSVLLTHGIESLKSEMFESSEPLIEPIHGRGSQELTNLLLTGKAVSNVYNGDKDFGGLVLKGISEQSEIGYLSLLEHLGHIVVGTYLKSPKNPIWVLSSDMHLTVIFSDEKRLISEETRNGRARRVFQSFAKDGGSIQYIECEDLGDILQQLDLEADPDYLALMISNLDPYGTGKISRPAFMNEFFPTSETFSIFHWNGMVQSNRDEEVSFKQGCAFIDETDGERSLPDDTLSKILQTKWSHIDVDWDSEKPSID